MSDPKEPCSRRNFFTAASQAAAVGLAAALIPGTAHGRELKPESSAAGYMSDDFRLDIRKFGAVGEGKTINTAAIQKALDAAGKTQSSIFIPSGVFLSGMLHVPPYVGIYGNPAWVCGGAAGEQGGSIIRLCDASARCLLDITDAFGFFLNGVCFDGANLGEYIHGICGIKKDYGPEDSMFFERCRIGDFTGDGIHLDRKWVFTIRHCQIARNKGNGLAYRCWDGWILDSWFSNNGQAGISTFGENASVTMTGNRIEWNKRYGILIKGGTHYNITGNYIDRSSGPGLAIIPDKERGTNSWAFTVTGNIFYRSGAPHGGPFADQYQSCHLRLEEVDGIACSCNSFDVGKDDGGKGDYSPDYGIVIRALSNSIIKDNVLNLGAQKQLIVDLGEHGKEFIIKDNVGTLFTPDWWKKPAAK